MTVAYVGLSDAAASLRMSYHRAYRLVLIGTLDGRKADNGRWEIAAASVERLAAERQAENRKPAA